MFSYHFSSVFYLFTIVQGFVKTRSKICRTAFKCLLKLFKVIFVLFPLKLAYWWPVWSLIGPSPPKDSSTVQFCTCKWKGYCRKPVLQYAHTLRDCTTNGPCIEDEKGILLEFRRRQSVRSFSKHWEVRQLHYCLQLHTTFDATMDEDMFNDLLRDEPMGLNPCNDSIDDWLMVWEPIQLLSWASQCSATMHPTRMHFWVKKNNGLDIQKCVVCFKKIHRGWGTH